VVTDLMPAGSSEFLVPESLRSQSPFPQKSNSRISNEFCTQFYPSPLYSVDYELRGEGGPPVSNPFTFKVLCNYPPCISSIVNPLCDLAGEGVDTPPQKPNAWHFPLSSLITHPSSPQPATFEAFPAIVGATPNGC